MPIGGICIKAGGRATADAGKLRDLVREIAALRREHPVVFIHGGGAEVSRVSGIFGLEPMFRDGIRLTSPEEMPIVDMVLAGGENKRLVRAFNTAGCAAVGISGADGPTFTGKSLDGITRTGAVTQTDLRLLSALISGGFLPVLSSVSTDREGVPLNINADEAALAVAVGMQAEHLVFLSDIPGVRKGEEIMGELDRPAVEREIEAGTITGGMIPKVRSSLMALDEGVGEIIIGEYTKPGDLKRLLTGAVGTQLNIHSCTNT
jgi:acetylglutamate kinase